MRVKKIDCESLVFLDIPTRNYTYLMLEAGLKFQITFERLEDDGVHFLNYFQEYDGCRRWGGLPKTFD